ncbi:PhzF family phenazine biosynthesis protein [Streptomyces sp. RS10V-4]|uniref:PhzF family phenazine biosynthesis protein n=1 Tax=Streptomyces rhizoryzae TaxID=2932493 RepID=UPI0020046EA4|nr:PhzF family phenazine biosynthesis protein [Streptomyces rhizoryzae]MCK7624486.1 PhzF family phenazine biosynthesis protein [Streptomyces rhizoryzae]
MTADILFLRVFCGPGGEHGNVLGVVRDGRAFPDERSRQALARELGLSETVFIDDAERGVVDIYTPGTRLSFAGYPLVGVAWLLGLETLELSVGSILVRRAEGCTWIRARAEWVPPRTLRQYGSAQEVDGLAVPEPGEWVYAWAWQDEAAGRIRARGFPGRGDGIDEDEATGAAALLLADRLGRAVTVTQGSGSHIMAAPGPDGTTDIGGRVCVVDDSWC